MASRRAANSPRIGEYYILNGEKKWATSGALSGLFTVMARQTLLDPATGKSTEKVTALVCTPDMPGVNVFQKNRSKCGIRGTCAAHPIPRRQSSAPTICYTRRGRVCTLP